MRRYIFPHNFNKLIFAFCLCFIAIKPHAKNNSVQNIEHDVKSFDYKKIDNEDCILQYRLTHDTLTITYITNEGVLSKKYIHRTLNQEIQQFKRAIKTHGKELEDLAYKLSEKLISPFSAELLERKNIVIVPDKYFMEIAFECLRLKEHLLIQSHTISYHHTLNTFLKKTNQKTRPSICLMAPITKGDIQQNAYVRSSTNSHFALPYTFNEVQTTAKIFQNMQLHSRIFHNHEATANNLRQAIASQDIVHIASHGDSENNGIFIRKSNTREKYSLESFNGSSLKNRDIKADLIVLSACKTATSSPNQTSLLFQVLNKGIPNVIGSLWNVHDKKTEIFMSLFYKHLIEEKRSYAQALRFAKIDCIKQGFLPMDWAGFILFRQ